MTILFTTDTTSVELDIVSSIIFGTTRVVNIYVFGDGTDTILDEGKSVDNITLKCTKTSNYFESMASLNLIMDNQEDVAVTGMYDSNLDTNYLITNLDFEGFAGIPNRYDFTVTLERKKDLLPYSSI